jgi:hypothetical protein
VSVDSCELAERSGGVKGGGDSCLVIRTAFFSAGLQLIDRAQLVPEFWGFKEGVNVHR